jgi:hypothetical protein
MEKLDVLILLTCVYYPDRSPHWSASVISSENHRHGERRRRLMGKGLKIFSRVYRPPPIGMTRFITNAAPYDIWLEKLLQPAVLFLRCSKEVRSCHIG